MIEFEDGQEVFFCIVGNIEQKGRVLRNSSIDSDFVFMMMENEKIYRINKKYIAYYSVTRNKMDDLILDEKKINLSKRRK